MWKKLPEWDIWELKPKRAIFPQVFLFQALAMIVKTMQKGKKTGTDKPFQVYPLGLQAQERWTKASSFHCPRPLWGVTFIHELG
jgi:hypothetical protein